LRSSTAPAAQSSFRYIVTTGNEAVLESSDFIDYMLDEGETDVFLLLIESDQERRKIQARRREKALKRGKPLIVAQDRPVGAGKPRGCVRTPRRSPARRPPTAPCSSATD
jgi:acyl-CoA synthetase (NDP forming)